MIYILFANLYQNGDNILNVAKTNEIRDMIQEHVNKGKAKSSCTYIKGNAKFSEGMVRVYITACNVIALIIVFTKY